MNKLFIGIAGFMGDVVRLGALLLILVTAVNYFSDPEEDRKKVAFQSK